MGIIGSIEHRLYFIIESLVIKVVNFNGLEIFFGIEVSLGNQKCLP
jgi:hypothetical protein